MRYAYPPCDTPTLSGKDGKKSKGQIEASIVFHAVTCFIRRFMQILLK
jgi:hypothetical protein